jgi:hypothetical protein
MPNAKSNADMARTVHEEVVPVILVLFFGDEKTEEREKMKRQLSTLILPAHFVNALEEEATDNR